MDAKGCIARDVFATSRHDYSTVGVSSSMGAVTNNLVHADSYRKHQVSKRETILRSGRHVKSRLEAILILISVVASRNGGNFTWGCSSRLALVSVIMRRRFLQLFSGELRGPKNLQMIIVAPGIRNELNHTCENGSKPSFRVGAKSGQTVSSQLGGVNSVCSKARKSHVGIDCSCFGVVILESLRAEQTTSMSR